jgi:hypothetical protein
MNIKILVSYHKPFQIFSDDILTPIHLGRALAKDGENDGAAQLLDILGDDTGDNISSKNPAYNELTAIYWAWKNYDALGNPDYIGFMHYRRHFVFKESRKKYFECKKIPPDYLRRIGCTKENITSILSNHDFVVNAPHKRASVYNHFKNAHDISELDSALEIIAERHPDYKDAANRYVFGKYAFFYNMFVFPREIFFEYAKWIFDVLSELEKVRGAGGRLFVSERLTGIFVTKLLLDGKKPAFLPTMYIADARQSFSEVKKSVKQNLKDAKSRDFKKKLYAMRPLILYLMPSFLVRLYRNRK